MKILVELLAKTWPLHQNIQERGPTESLLNIPMILRSKLGDLRSTKADTNKCLVCFRAVIVLSVTEECCDGGRPRALLEVFPWVSKASSKVETASKTATSLLQSILPHRKWTSEDSVSH